MFPLLKYPSYNIRLKQDAKQNISVFDNIRKKWLVLTPEEWVRQHTVNYLTEVKKFPATLIALEKEIELNGTKRRCDIVVYSKDLKPFIIIECKAFEIDLSQAVLDQALRYNLVLSVPYIMITNGLADAIYHFQERIDSLPDHS